MADALPLVNLSLLRPLVAGLRARRTDPEPVLAAAGLTEAAIADDAASVHVMVVHEFLERCAVATGDVHFCGSVAMALEPAGWPMIRAALDAATSLAQFLAIFVSRSNEVSASVTTYLNVSGDLAIFGETRVFRPTILPSQNDAFMAALSVSILKRVLGDHMDPGRIMVVVCDPASLPPDLGGFQVLRGDEMGFRVQFPSAWLGQPVGWHDPAVSDAMGAATLPDRDFLSDFRRLLDQQIGHGGLSAPEAAALLKMRRETLSRRLARHGTTIKAELQRAKLAYARRALHDGDASIEEIAAAIGYTEPANFSRAFRKIEGMSPSQFRSASRQPT